MKLADKILEVEKDYKQFKLVTLGNYLPFKKIGNLVYVSGQLPIKDEKIITGKVPSETDIKEASYGSRICMLNTLSILDQLNPSCELSDFNCIHVAGYVNADHSFSDHPLVINGASDVVCEIMGEKGKHSRIAVGASSLPKNASVEVASIFEILK